MAALIGVSVKPAAGGGYTCRVPLDLLSQDGVPPEKGDSVDYSVSGTVQSTDDEDAVIKIDSVNGQPVAESPAEEAAEDAGTSPSTADMGKSLRARAKGQPLPF